MNVDPEEVIVDVKEYEGLYRISNYGYILNSSGHKLSPNIDRDGYHLIHLRKAGVRKVFKIHRLVMYHFHSIQSLAVDHIFGDKSDNRVWRLRYSTDEENMQNAVKLGLCTNSSQKGENHNTAKFKFSQIQEIREKYSKGGYTMRKLADEFNTSSGYICAVVNLKIRQTI